MSTSKTTFGINIAGCDHGIPENLTSTNGHSIGVGKNSVVWVGKSSAICKNHAVIGQKGRFRTAQTITKKSVKITALCVKSYK